MLIQIEVVNDRGEYIDVIKHYNNGARSIATLTRADYLDEAFELRLRNLDNAYNSLGNLAEDYRKVIDAVREQAYDDGYAQGAYNG